MTVFIILFWLHLDNAGEILPKGKVMEIDTNNIFTDNTDKPYCFTCKRKSKYDGLDTV